MSSKEDNTTHSKTTGTHLQYLTNERYFSRPDENCESHTVIQNGDVKEFSNYRPVSILSQFSKILEKVFHNRLMSYINDKQILNNSQFGFRKNMSTALAIIELVEEITTAIDKGKTTVGVH